jgi:tetratricopeptide (TPR) repeat protein
LYTIFLNIISLEITPFGLPSCIALAILIGIGISQVLETVRQYRAMTNMTRRSIHVAFCLVPAIPLTLNYHLTDQSLNYTAYEHVLNIFRTVDKGGTIFLDGDNNIFPVAYGRIAERMREDVSLFDRHNLFFKMPLSIRDGDHSFAKEEMHGPSIAKEIIDKGQKGVYAALFNPHAILIPDHYAMRPLGILYKVVPRNAPQDIGGTVWPYYVTESVYDPFVRDFMNRQVAAYFHFCFAKYLFSAGQTNLALKSIGLASTVGYDDTTIHSDIAVFLTDQGLFDDARRELEKALIYYEDLSGVYNNWGYYYHHLGDYNQAALSYGRALDLCPNNSGYYNNLGLALHHAGRKNEAVEAFSKSLSICENQPRLEAFLKNQDIMERRPRTPSSSKTSPDGKDVCQDT